MNGQDLSNFSMLDLFRMEVSNQVAILSDCLLTLETKPDISEELAALMRAAHSIKGAARIVQVDAAVKVAHIMEDCFVAAQAGTITFTPAQIDVLLQSTDLLVRIAESTADPNHWPSEQDADIQACIAAISAILAIEPKTVGESTLVPTPVQIGKLQLSDTTAQLPVQVAEETVLQIVDPKQPTEDLECTQATLELNQPATVFNVPSTLRERAGTTTERVVRVSAENLDRLMGLAGESLVEANWLQPFSDALLKLKKRQAELSSHLEKLQESLTNQPLNQRATEQLNLTRQKANECHQTLAERLSELELFARRSANLSDRLYREVIASHMRPFADGIQGFPRMVRDLARQLGKQVKLEVVGKTTDVDRDILEKLEAPLTHLLRNAIDHGIETSEERLAAGKPAEGTVQIEAAHRAGMLSITVSDDGRGIDLEQLRQTVVQKQLTSAEMATQLSEAELMEFLFLPGFSTVKNVTEISGRGVGLDVAQTMVQGVGGVLRAVSQQGQGISFHLQLPLTLSVMRTLLVQIAGEPYAFPLTRIDQIVMLPKADIATVENRQYFTLNHQHIGLVSATQVLELPEAAVNPEVFPAIVISDRFSRYGIVVDRFLGERNLVVRPLDSRLGKVRNISAAALMEDGSPVLIVDVEDLVRSIDNLLVTGQLSKVSHTKDSTISKTYQKILVVDDSITVREMERKLLENRGYKVEVAVNGMDGWNAVRTGHYSLVITDIDMPRMNGIELVSQIKNNPALKSLPVVIVSYKDREEDRIRGLEAGADYYLTKSSFHDDRLLNAVMDLIGEA